MHRAALPEEAPLEPLRDSVGLQQHPEEALSVIGVIRGVAAILEERNRIAHLHRHRPHLHGDPETVENAHVRPVEVRDRLRSQSDRSEEHTSELQSPYDLVCRLLLEKKKK